MTSSASTLQRILDRERRGEISPKRLAYEVRRHLRQSGAPLHVGDRVLTSDGHVLVLGFVNPEMPPKPGEVFAWGRPAGITPYGAATVDITTLHGVQVIAPQAVADRVPAIDELGSIIPNHIEAITASGDAFEQATVTGTAVQISARRRGFRYTVTIAIPDDSDFDDYPQPRRHQEDEDELA